MIRAQKINRGTMTQTAAIDAASVTMRELKSGRAPVTDAGVVAARDIGFLWAGRFMSLGRHALAIAADVERFKPYSAIV